jgi:microcystin-dependent protein
MPTARRCFYICGARTPIWLFRAAVGFPAAADWGANKTIALPDWRGRALAGLDDMGNTAAGVLTSAYFGTAPTALGASGGSQSLTLIQDNLPALPLSISGNVTVTTTNQLLSSNAQVTAFSKVDGGGVGFAAFGAGSTQVVTFQNSTGTVTSGSTANMGLGTAQPNVTPTKLATIYVKL